MLIIDASGNMGESLFKAVTVSHQKAYLSRGFRIRLSHLVCTGRGSPCFEGKLRASNRDQRGAVASGAFGLLSDPVSVAVVRLPSFGLTQHAIEQRRARVRGTLGM